MKKLVCGENRCTACMACVDICPKNAITIKDTLSEYNAVIDANKCIGCNACHRVCQVENPPKLSTPIYHKEGFARDETIRKTSSSGGFAAAIGRAFVRDGGVVCSCASVDGGVFGFCFAETEDEISRFTGSKYVKSNPSGAYKKIRALLREGKKVLFIGLPCQSAALKNFIGDNERLYTVDLICHGTPSVKMLESYLKDFGKNLNSSAQKLSFRNGNSYQLEEKGRPFTRAGIKDDYTWSFLKSVFYTENCYSCRYASLDRVSDITLGDSWGSELPEQEAVKGVSLALCQSQKGVELLKSAEVELLDTDLDRAVEYNHQLRHPSIKPRGSDKFFLLIKRGKSFKKAFRKSYPKVWCKNRVKTILGKIKT